MSVSDLTETEPPDPPEPPRRERTPKVSISIRFSADLAEELRRLGEAQHRSFNGTVNEACKRYVRQMRPRHPKDTPDAG